MGRFVVLWMLMWSALAGPRAPEAPILRVEAEQHSALIRAIVVDARGQVLVTTSLDKTARVWDLRTGALLRVLRPPIAAGDDGELYAAPLSPDGRVVALAGWSKLAGKTSGHGIWLFEVGTGRLMGRIGELPDVVHSLAFSPDGARLAAGLGGPNGVRVFDVARREALRVAGGVAMNDTYSVEFDAAGRLLTASDDGHLRLYDAALKRVAEVSTGEGRRPISARFSPDGREVAVGFDGEPRVERRSAHTLGDAVRMPGDALNGGDLSSVVWTTDGRLCAGGTARDPAGEHVLRCWGPSGAPVDQAVSGNTIMALQALPGGAVAVGAADPRWAVARPEGLGLVKGPSTLNYARSAHGLRADTSGAQVSFGAGQADAPLLSFNLDTGRLAEGETPGLVGPFVERPGLVVTDWEIHTAPKLNGRPLTGLHPNERSVSVAVHPDAQRVVLGADFFLRLYDDLGEILATSEGLPGPAWSVTWSGDGRLVIAAIGDGTLRWYHGETLAPLLTLFVHPDRRWIAWTPSGYYMASPGGEGLALWHLNQGVDAAATVASLGTLRARFSRPDVVLATLHDLGEGEATQTPVCANLPPSVQAEGVDGPLRVGEAPTALTVRVHRPCAQAAQVTAVTLKANGRGFLTLKGEALAAASATVPEDPLALRVTLPLKGLPPETDTVSVFATSDMAGEPIVLPVAWDGPRTSPLPRLIVLAVGVEDPHRDLRYPDDDARRFADLWRRRAAGSYAPNPSITVLTNEQATRRAILDALEALRRSADRSTDVVILMLAGHAQAHPDYEEFVFKAGGAQEGSFLDYLEGDDLTRVLSRLVGKVVLFMDTCAAANIGAVARARGDSVDFANALHSVESGVIVFAASAASGRSLEDKRWGGGVFTYAVLKGLEGGAKDNSGLVTLAGLERYVQETVLDETQNAQLPRMLWPPDQGSAGSFPVLRVVK